MIAVILPRNLLIEQFVADAANRGGEGIVNTVLCSLVSVKALFPFAKYPGL